jgi:hypothetical protein
MKDEETAKTVAQGRGEQQFMKSLVKMRDDGASERTVTRSYFASSTRRLCRGVARPKKEEDGFHMVCAFVGMDQSWKYIFTFNFCFYQTEYEAKL